jgi:hypothetical protein
MEQEDNQKDLAEQHLAQRLRLCCDPSQCVQQAAIAHAVYDDMYLHRALRGGEGHEEIRDHPLALRLASSTR